MRFASSWALALVFGGACVDGPQSGLAPDVRPALGAGAASAVIGQGGGTVSLPGSASVSVPAGAVDEPTRFFLRTLQFDELPPLDGELAVASGAVSFEPHERTFAAPLSVSLVHTAQAEAALLWLENTADTQWWARDAAVFERDITRLETDRLGIFVVGQGPAFPDASMDAGAVDVDGGAPDAG